MQSHKNKCKQVRCFDSVLNTLTVEKSQLMDKLQALDTSLIELGFGYEERKRLLQSQLDRFYEDSEVAK